MPILAKDSWLVIELNNDAHHSRHNHSDFSANRKTLF
jgi:hypothetical protein